MRDDARRWLTCAQAQRGGAQPGPTERQQLPPVTAYFDRHQRGVGGKRIRNQQVVLDVLAPVAPLDPLCRSDGQHPQGRRRLGIRDRSRERPDEQGPDNRSHNAPACPGARSSAQCAHPPILGGEHRPFRRRPKPPIPGAAHRQTPGPGGETSGLGPISGARAASKSREDRWRPIERGLPRETTRRTQRSGTLRSKPSWSATPPSRRRGP